MTSYNKNEPKTIQLMFGSIANNYDKTNAILSFQLHKLWNRSLIKKTIRNTQGSLADLCCGTGMVAYSWLKKETNPCKAFMVDFCPEMLVCAKSKAWDMQLDKIHELCYLQADVQAIPMSAASVDFATMAYGIRNVNSPLKCFNEVHRILKDGGTFGILELTEPGNPLLRLGHKIYLKCLLPILGRLFTSNQQAYEYLSRSIQSFSKPSELAVLLSQAGFKDIEITPLTGGIATIITAKVVKR